METKKFSENGIVFVANAFVLIPHFVLVMMPDAPDIWIGMLVFYGVTIPMVIYAYREVKLNNYLVKYGHLIKAKIHHEETKMLFPGVRHAVCFQVQCIYMEDGVVHIFKGRCAVATPDIERFRDTLDRKDTIDVLVDSKYKKYKIVFGSVYEDLGYDHKCPAHWNYLLFALNIGSILLYLSM